MQYQSRLSQRASPLVRFAILANKEFLEVPREVGTGDGTPDDAFGVAHEAHAVVRGHGQGFLQVLQG